MIDSGTVTGITVDLARNVLLLHLDVAGGAADVLPPGEYAGILDVGANGWLLGVEIADTYFPIADAAPGTEHLVRSCDARPSLTDDGATIVVPRRGPGYELSFPSGNQCWLRSGSTPGSTPVRLCSTVASSR